DAIPGTTNIDTTLLSPEEQSAWNGSPYFASIPLTAETKDLIVRSVLPRIGLERHIWHILIGRPFERVFASYDQFDPRGRGADVNLPPAVLDDLLSQGLVERYVRDPSREEMLEFWEPRR